MEQKERVSVDKSKIIQFLEGLKKDDSTEKQLVAAFLQHVAELTQEYANNIEQFCRQNPDVVAAIRFSIVIGVDNIFDKDRPGITMGMGMRPSLTAIKLLNALIQKEKEAGNDRS